MGFIKKQEDFVCEKCGTEVKGTGFTNHCPNCLFLKHVDKNIPGDRIESCQGLMEPIEVEFTHGKYSLPHRYQKCGKMTKKYLKERSIK